MNIINTKENLIMNSLTKFYSVKKNIELLTNIVNGKSRISLRLIDWFVTNFSKKCSIVYKLTEEGKKEKYFNVFLDYKAQLKAYSKKQFDPFCRRERISFIYNTFDDCGEINTNNTSEIITTVGQLNFFKWAIQKKIINCIENNFTIIENDMNTSLKNAYSNKEIENDENGKAKRKKRKELSVSATKTIHKDYVKIIINFD
jgi:hypothetical protein